MKLFLKSIVLGFVLMVCAILSISRDIVLGPIFFLLFKWKAHCEYLKYKSLLKKAGTHQSIILTAGGYNFHYQK